jgi:hypothetical protein
MSSPAAVALSGAFLLVCVMTIFPLDAKTGTQDARPWPTCAARGGTKGK